MKVNNWRYTYNVQNWNRDTGFEPQRLSKRELGFWLNEYTDVIWKLINDYEHFCLLTAYLNTPAVCVHVNKHSNMQ